MFVEVDLGTVPPAVALREPDDLSSFAVRVRAGEHSFVAVEELRALAGERAEDPEWAAAFERMLAYAESKGWRGEDGSVRAHVEIEP